MTKNENKTMITGRWWKIDKVLFDWDWGNWCFGLWFHMTYLRKTGIDIGPLSISFDHERVLIHEN